MSSLQLHPILMSSEPQVHSRCSSTACSQGIQQTRKQVTAALKPSGSSMTCTKGCCEGSQELLQLLDLLQQLLLQHLQHRVLPRLLLLCSLQLPPLWQAGQQQQQQQQTSSTLCRHQ
jgi:hypothetical protein